MKVTFLLARTLLPTTDWDEAIKKGDQLQLAPLGNAATGQSMIYQTWFWLKQAGISCELQSSLPKKGIVIFGSYSFLSHTPLPPGPFYIDVLTDGRLLPSTHFHLVQNRAKARWIPYSLFVPHWPQPMLIPRDPKRGARFEKVSFFGDIHNLAPELQSPEWMHQLRRELGLFLDFPVNSRWHDYSETDAVLAIRDFSRSLHHNKPAAKLYNAWLAGVPFIGGRDSAYATDGRPGINYLRATSPQEVIRHLRRLKEDLGFREQLVARGHQASVAFSHEAILSQWKKLIQETLPELALKWKKKSYFQQQLFWKTQKCSRFVEDCLKKPNYDEIMMEKTLPGINTILKNN